MEGSKFEFYCGQKKKKKHLPIKKIKRKGPSKEMVNVNEYRRELFYENFFVFIYWINDILVLA